jgi:hypothetical protein
MYNYEYTIVHMITENIDFSTYKLIFLLLSKVNNEKNIFFENLVIALLTLPAVTKLIHEKIDENVTFTLQIPLSNWKYDF